VTQQWETELAAEQERARQQAAALQQRVEQLEQECQELSRREEQLKTALGQSSNTKIQVLSARVKEQEKEVRSLQAVLELKREEMADLRRDLQELEQLRELRLSLEERCTKYRAKAEDLEAQLRQRALVERQLSEENARLAGVQDRENKANKRLSMENEQLQYKLRVSQHELMTTSTPGSCSVLSRSASFRTPRTSCTSRGGSESPHPAGR